jgi:hypothetical protein
MSNYNKKYILRMIQKISVVSALLGVTSAAVPAGVRNKDWPLWDTKITLKANTSAGVANDNALIGNYPVGCYRSDGWLALPQKSDPSNKIILDDTVNRAMWGNTAAHTGTLATTASLTTVSWTCCTVVDNTNCAGKTDSSGKVFDKVFWAWNLKQKEGTTGTLGTN